MYRCVGIRLWFWKVLNFFHLLRRGMGEDLQYNMEHGKWRVRYSTKDSFRVTWPMCFDTALHYAEETGGRIWKDQGLLRDKDAD